MLQVFIDRIVNNQVASTCCMHAPGKMEVIGKGIAIFIQ